jgi:hypothetical protein|eukprot:COSAG02_NODE_2569_length_8510_cov_2048.640827_6_plen_80_part_00
MRRIKKSTEKFDGHITKRGTNATQSAVRDKNARSIGPILLGFFLFVVVGSAFLQIIRTATMGGGPPAAAPAADMAAEGI